MNLLRSQSDDAIGIGINEISFPSLLRVLKNLPSLELEKRKHNFMNDDSDVSFVFKGVKFRMHTPLSDYWIEKPEDCPKDTFNELVEYLERTKVRWWHRLI